MSSDYTNTISLGPILCDTPSDEEIIAYIPSGGFAFNVHSLNVVIQTAGAQSSGTIVLETSEASPVEVCTAATGTSAARTSIVAIPVLADGDDVVPSTKPLQLRYNGTTDASLRCWIQVNMTKNFE